MPTNKISQRRLSTRKKCRGKGIRLYFLFFITHAPIFHTSSLMVSRHYFQEFVLLLIPCPPWWIQMNIFTRSWRQSTYLDSDMIHRCSHLVHDNSCSKVSSCAFFQQIWGDDRSPPWILNKFFSNGKSYNIILDIHQFPIYHEYIVA